MRNAAPLNVKVFSILGKPVYRFLKALIFGKRRISQVMLQKYPQFLSLLIVIAGLGVSHAQELQLGGRVGASTLHEQDGEHLGEAVTPGGTAGLFAAWQNEPLRLGLRVEVNYRDQRDQADGEWQVPVMGTVPLDKQRLVELQAGPYVSVQNDPEPLPRPINWGFSTGLQLNLPLSQRWILSSQARADQELGSQPNVELAPARSLSFSFTFGLAYLL